MYEVGTAIAFVVGELVLAGSFVLGVLVGCSLRKESRIQ